MLTATTSRKALASNVIGDRQSYSPAELAARWHCSAESVLALIHAGALVGFPVSPPGRKRPRYRVSAKAVADYEAGRVVHQEEKPARRQRPRRAAGYVERY